MIDYNRYSTIQSVRDLTDMEILAILAERNAAIDRLIESEEVRVDEDGLPYWTSCGEWIGST